MAFVSQLAAVSLLFSCAEFVGASSFLSRAQGENGKDLTPELEASIHQEIEEVLAKGGHDMTEARLTRIEDMLQGTYKSLPKNEQGRLSPAAVRYALHSYFVQRHAWYVRGLSDMNADTNSSSPTDILQDKVEDFVQAAFEQRMGSHGLDLKDMAVLAATYENLVHKEMAQRLDDTFWALGMTGRETMTADKVDSVMDVYLMGYILNLKVEPYKLHLVISSVQQIYPTWPETQKFLRSVRAGSGLHRSYFTRSDVESFLEQVFDQYGRWQDRECQDLKTKLLALEDRSIGVNGSGRVKLTDFYGSALRDGNWQFSETTDYLAQNGALDTHGVERIIIANYINSPSNCLASSKFYSVCCINECEDLMDHVEHHFAAPSAAPLQILQFISSLSSSTVAAGRRLHDVLVRRLEDIASRYDGQVPLHGRLFAQWMHHAYPRECPYPHISGTTRPQSVADYVAEGKNPVVNKDRMVQVVDAPQRLQAGSDEVTLWSHDEELYVGDHRTGPRSEGSRSIWHAVRPVVYMCGIGATLIALLQRPALGLVSSKQGAYGGKDLYV